MIGGVFATDATIIVDSSAASLSVVGFSATDSFAFNSPAVSAVYTPISGGSDYTDYAIGTLAVTEENGAVVSITLDAINGYMEGSYYPNYQQGNFVIVNGAVDYATAAPPVKPVITGTPGQIIREGVSVSPFYSTIVTDTNTGATETAVVLLAAVTGTLVDPNAATDGSTYTAGAGYTGGTYTVEGTAQAVTQALEGLVFTPNDYTLSQGGSFNTNFNLTVTSSAGTSATVTTTVTTFAAIIPENFAGNGTSGILMQNSDGAAIVYATNGLAVTAATSLGDPGPTWHIVASADFNGDGESDILLQNDSGALVDYLMSGTGVVAAGSLGNPGSSWHVRGTGDFNSDGYADILLQNDNGSMVILEASGSGLIGSAALGTLPAGWEVEGVADFNGDGRPDILVQGPDGTLVIYVMTGTSIAYGGVLGNPGPGYSVAGAGNYNGDTKADILLHNDDGVNVVWDVNDTALAGGAFVGNSGAGSTVVAGLDLDGDGHSDLVAQNPATSTLTASIINGSTAVTASNTLGTPGVGWSVVGSNPIVFLDGTGATLDLAGTPGPDQFNLTSDQAGIHQITGFDPAQDTLALSLAAFPSYAVVQANEAPYQGGTFINLSPTAAIVIQGVTPGQLTASDFVLR